MYGESGCPTTSKMWPEVRRTVHETETRTSNLAWEQMHYILAKSGLRHRILKYVPTCTPYHLKRVLSDRQMFLCLRAQHPALQTARRSLPDKRCNIKRRVAEMNGQWACTTPSLPVKKKHNAKWRCQAAPMKRKHNSKRRCRPATPAFCNNPQDSALIARAILKLRVSSTHHWNTDVLCKFKVEHQILHSPTSLSINWTVELVFILCDIFVLFAH